MIYDLNSSDESYTHLEQAVLKSVLVFVSLV